jgi:hypothetical protein
MSIDLKCPCDSLLASSLAGEYCASKENDKMKKYAWLAAFVLLAVLLFGSIPALAQTTIYVDDDNCPGPGAGTPADPYCKIQDAINAASPGDVINVNPGTYDGALTIAKPITLSGADKLNTIITYTGSPVEQLVFLGTNTGLDLDGPVVIENFTFFNGGGLFGDNDLLKFRARGVGGQITIRNNVFDCDGDGSIPSDPGPAKAIEEAYQASNFAIIDNEFNNCRYGVWLNSGQSGAISNNILSGSASGAIGMGGSGVGALAPHDLTVTGNTMDSGKYGLILARNIYDISFSCNTITNNSFAGILFWEYGPENWSNVLFNYNNIAGNTSGMRGYSDPGATPVLTVDATNNWWGDASGPSGNGLGTGDSVLLNNVDFDPWLMVEIGDICPPPSDNEGPITSNVVADPNPASVDATILLTANVDDSTTGGSSIASAEYSLDGSPWLPMAAQDGIFDEVTENVTVTFNAPATAGIYDLCIRGTDVYQNTGSQECVLFVVYDPDGGFVTGGGWINSPSGAYMPDPDAPVVVTPANVGVDWFSPDMRGDGYVAFVEGPATPPLGVGSLEMGTSSGSDKAQLFNYDHVGVLLADIDALSYATYRHSSSTNPPVQYPAINMEVDFVGNGSSYTTLVWEPIYAYGQANLAVDTWQTWDTMASSQTGFGGGWWSTRDIPGICAFNCFVDWDTIVQNNPNAKIVAGVGVNVGSGWNGMFTGDVDALTLSVSGDTVTYDFEPVAPSVPVGKATFGFVSKYKKGAETPEGNTEFVFQAADLNFHSTSYDWLVVTGSDYAKFKGSGTINGAGDYKFQLWAGDGEPDTFRIKIWWEENDIENVIYDNGMDQPIAGGNIVVHTAKK